MQFNERVLSLVAESGIPLLERVKFCAICSSNLDEFFQVRVAALKDQVAAGLDAPSPDGLTPASSSSPSATPVDAMVLRQEGLLLGSAAARAEAAAASRCSTGSSSSWPTEREMTDVFEQRIFPVLTPLAVDPAHPFPYISNLALSLAAMVSDPDTGERRFARVKVPTVFPRLIALSDGRGSCPSSRSIAAHLHLLFSGMVVEECAVFRVTRNADLTLEDEDADDLLAAVELELRRRRFGRAVRLEAQAGMSAEMVELLVRELDLEPADVSFHATHARPDLPVAAGRARPSRAEGHAVAAGHRRPHRRRRRGRAQHLLGHPRTTAAGAPPVRELRQQHRELHRPGGRRPQGAVDQDDDVPRRAATAPSRAA